MPKHWTEQQWVEMFVVTTTETTNIESFLGIQHHAPTSKQYKLRVHDTLSNWHSIILRST